MLTEMEHFDGILPLATEVLGDSRGVEECVHNNSADPLSQLFVLLGYHTSIHTYIHTTHDTNIQYGIGQVSFMESCLCVVRGSSDYSRSYEVRNADKQHLYGDPVGDSSNESKQSYCPQHTHTDTPWSLMRMFFQL